MNTTPLSPKRALDYYGRFYHEAWKYVDKFRAGRVKKLPEIGDDQRRPDRPQARKTNKGLRMFPATKVNVWDVGVRMGAALRRAKAKVNVFLDTEDMIGSKNTKQRSSPRPHVRCAHRHGYWTGPRGGNQNFIVKWLHPVLVGAGASEDNKKPVVIRPVK